MLKVMQTTKELFEQCDGILENTFNLDDIARENLYNKIKDRFYKNCNYSESLFEEIHMVAFYKFVIANKDYVECNDFYDYYNGYILYGNWDEYKIVDEPKASIVSRVTAKLKALFVA